MSTLKSPTIAEMEAAGLRADVISWLCGYGIKSLSELHNWSDRELLRVPGLGRVQLGQIRRASPRAA
jgi:hypothetical protein